MKPRDAAKLALLFAGVAAWMVSVRTGNRALTVVAIAILAVAFLLRFAGQRPNGSSSP